jgi:hypothetical protein
MNNEQLKKLKKEFLLILLSISITGADENLMKMFNNEKIGEAILIKQTMFADSRGVGTTFTFLYRLNRRILFRQ